MSSKEEVVMEMTELRVLDMSEDRDHHPFEMFVSIGSKTNEFLNREKVLEHLTAIDISGMSGFFIFNKLKKLPEWQT